VARDGTLTDKPSPMTNRPSGDTPMSPQNSLQPNTEHGAARAPEDSLQPNTANTARRRCKHAGCGRPAVPNRQYCLLCLERAQAAYWHAVRTGICTRCKKAPAEEGHRRCEACAAKVRQESARRYQRTKQQGICTYCRHHEAMPHRELCFACIKKYGRIGRARRQRQQTQWVHWLLVILAWARQRP
jgi:hypothetical protein